MSAIEPFLLALRDADAVSVHLRAGEAPGWRVGGQIVSNGDPLPATAPFEALLLELVAEAGKSEQFRDQPDFQFSHECGGARFRIQIYRTPEGRNAVINQIADTVLSPHELGLPGALREAAGAKSGVVLISGAAGSGRRTTVASLLESINQSVSRYIVSIERPVVFNIVPHRSMVHQIQVGHEAPSFAAGIGTAMAARANVIAVGAVADEESAKLVVRAAEAGALVLAVVTAHGVADALGRMLDLLPAQEHGFYRSCLAENLCIATYQQLVPGTGTEPVGAFEFVSGTAEVAALIRGDRLGELTKVLAERTRSRVHQSIDRCLQKLVKAGRIEREIAARLGRDRRSVERTVAE